MVEECIVCHDSPEELPELPEKSDPCYDEKIKKARHFFIPCFHANICGECVTLLCDNKCPTCREMYTDVRPFSIEYFS